MNLINADFCAGSVLITFGVLLGKVSLSQMLIIATFESFFWCLNEALVIIKIEAADIGGTMVIHMFGAYFGLVCSYFFKPKEANSSKENVSSYNHNLTAFAGTIFLFMYWPSFNAALQGYGSQVRSMVNTYLSIAASTVIASSCSRLYLGKLDVEVVLNATLAGGVVTN